ncbi:MAG: metallophosphoesterase [Verrucomicrobia bacterium]|nr:metallophosphoesterase [Verrucomicrobiota bacterium]
MSQGIRLVLLVGGIFFGGLLPAAEPGAGGTVTFVFTSDVHFGLTRGKFRGAANVESRVVGAALVEAVNGLPAAVLPDDGGLRAGRAVGPVDFVTITGDLTNRQERLPLKIQSAATSWAQFEPVFFGGLTVKNAAGRPAPLLLVPGNHDVSNAIGHPNGLLPATDATTLAQVYNRMLQPATPRTKDTYRFATDQIIYARDFGGAHCIFLTIWPDRRARAWIEEDLKKVPATTPVFLFAHDPPKGEARHFTNPNGTHDVNVRDKFENVLAEVYPDGNDGKDGTDKAQRALGAFLRAHRNVVGYFHGHSNWNEFYTWKSPDKDLELATFRADSPMKGRESGKDETKLSFQVVVYDVAAKRLTSRECLWNPTAGARPGVVAWGESVTVSIAPR